MDRPPWRGNLFALQGSLPLSSLQMSSILFFCLLCRLRAWTSCGSTVHSFRQEFSRSPAVLSSTCSLEAMPKFALSSEDESPCRGTAKKERPKFVVGDSEMAAPRTPSKGSALAGENRISPDTNSGEANNGNNICQV